MIEGLYVYAFLLSVGLASKTEYGEYLDALFLDAPDNDLLLNLEWSFSDTKNSVITIFSYCKEHDINYDVFGSYLCEKLSEAYKQHNEIKEFSKKSYRLWQLLPDKIQHIEPFWTLLYADDPLSWGDESQTRALYEKMFCYYDTYG